MGGCDKGLIDINGKPMIAYIIERLSPQVNRLMINANRNVERYAALGGDEVIEDSIGDYAGPLAGMAIALQRSTSRYVLTAPCDSPLIATDLGERLYASLQDSDAALSVAHDGARLQPVFALLRTELVSSLLAYLDSGEHKLDKWYAQHEVSVCDFSDRAETFANVNTPQDRDRLAMRLETAQ